MPELRTAILTGSGGGAWGLPEPSWIRQSDTILEPATPAIKKPVRGVHFDNLAAVSTQGCSGYQVPIAESALNEWNAWGSILIWPTEVRDTERTKNVIRLRLYCRSVALAHDLCKRNHDFSYRTFWVKRSERPAVELPEEDEEFPDEILANHDYIARAERAAGESGGFRFNEEQRRLQNSIKTRRSFTLGLDDEDDDE